MANDGLLMQMVSLGEAAAEALRQAEAERALLRDSAPSAEHMTLEDIDAELLVLRKRLEQLAGALREHYRMLPPDGPIADHIGYAQSNVDQSWRKIRAARSRIHNALSHIRYPRNAT